MLDLQNYIEPEMVHVPVSRHRERKAGRHEVQSYLQLHGKFGASLGYVSLCLTVRKKKKKYFEKMKQVWVVEVPLNPCLKIEVDILYHKAIVRRKHLKAGRQAAA